MRNKRQIAYKNYVRTDYDVDSNNRKTGNKTVVYSSAKFMYGTVSTPTGNAVLEMFGTNENYDKVVVVDMPDIDISENSVLWLDREMVTGNEFDYVVRRVIRNHNFLTIGVRKVDVRNATSSNNETQLPIGGAGN